MSQDWRNEAQYSYTQFLHSQTWAWEFLRRNSKYIAAWRELQEAIAAFKEHPSDPEIALRHAFAETACHEYGLLEFVDPKPSIVNRTPIWLGVLGVEISGFSSAPSDRAKPWPGYPHFLDLSFNFHHPLSPQIERAVRILEICAERVQREAGVKAENPRFRPNTERFTLYLRILDARLSGTSIAEIGRTLFGDKADSRKSAKGALKKASELADGGYRDLLLLVG